jgi:hypothetical protein
MTTARTETEKTMQAPAAERPILRRPDSVPRGRNRLLSIVLSCIAVAVFATVIALAVWFQEAQLYHELPGF